MHIYKSLGQIKCNNININIITFYLAYDNTKMVFGVCNGVYM